MNYFRNAIAKLYDAVSAPVASTHDALVERMQSVFDTVTFLYNRTREKLGYGETPTTLHDIVEKEAKQDYIELEDIKHLYGRQKETTDDGIEDIQYLFDDNDMLLIKNGRRLKTWRHTRNLNKNLTDTIMHKATPDIDMQTKVVYSFKCEKHRGGGEVGEHSKTKSSTGTSTSIREIQDFIYQCEIKRLDFEDNLKEPSKHQGHMKEKLFLCMYRLTLYQ